MLKKNENLKKYSLAIDTSNKECSVCLFKQDKIIDYDILSEINIQSKQLFYLIDKIFTQNQINYSNIKEIFVVIGPGSFTGIRVSIASAHGINIASAIPIFGITNFQIEAYKILQKKQNHEAEIIIAIQAGRNDYYLQKLNTKLQNLSNPELIDAKTFTKQYKQINNIIIPFQETKYNAKEAALCAYFLKANKSLHKISPLYIREADAKLQNKFQ